MRIMRRIIEIDEERCDGCGQCIPSCAEGALQIIDGKARVVAENLCDGLGACLGECPRGALRVVEREAEQFDESAVENHLSCSPSESEASAACGCPSARVQILEAGTASGGGKPAAADSQPADSALTHWPVQIRLVPPTAAFLKGAELLVLADCAAVAYPNLHRELVRGKVVLMGCPKFDEAEETMQRLAAIFEQAGPRRVTTVTMEVPCCQGLKRIVARALETAGGDIAANDIVVSTRGSVILQAPSAAA